MYPTCSLSFFTIEELLAQSICINGLLEISLLEQKFSGVCKSERAFICWCLELYESSLLMMISGQEHLYTAKRVLKILSLAS